MTPFGMQVCRDHPPRQHDQFSAVQWVVVLAELHCICIYIYTVELRLSELIKTRGGSDK